MTIDEKMKLTISWWKRLNRKLEGKPQPMQVLQRRTMNTALSVLENIEDLPFSNLSMSLYFYCQDLKMKEFTHLYENQIELAGANPEKFVFQLHKFYNDISYKIKKDNLYSEFFEFYYRCVRLRSEITAKTTVKVEDKVIIAYLNLLTQNLEYLRPSKFDFAVTVAGMTTTGEIMTRPDPYPNIDLASYEIEQAVESGLLKSNPIPAIEKCYAKYGYTVRTLEELHILTNVDKIHTITITSLLPLINEFTFDILPQTPFSTKAIGLELLSSKIDFEVLKDALTKRNRTLPSNGVVISFKDNPFYKSVLLKELYFDNSIFMLYRFTTVEGDLCGYYDTKGKFFHTVLRDYTQNPQVEIVFASLVLYLYACYALNKPEYQLSKVEDYFSSLAAPNLAAEGVLHGGKVRNVYKPVKEETVSGTARKGNEDYEAETKSIQGFIRKLPLGQKASDRAINLAESLGYDLAPDETYVQPFIKQVFKLKRKEEQE